MSYHRYVGFTKFGESRLVPRTIYVNGEEIANPGEYDDSLWVEQGEDMYALMSPQFRDKRVLVVHRSDWLKSRGIS